MTPLLSLLALSLFLFACGSPSSSPSKPYFYDPSKVVWQGNAMDRADFAGLYTQVENCLGLAAAPPMVTVIDAYNLDLGGGVYAWGYTDFSGTGVYVTTFAMSWYNGSPLAHEFVHWILHKGNEIHDTPEMNTCGGLTL